MANVNNKFKLSIVPICINKALWLLLQVLWLVLTNKCSLFLHLYVVLKFVNDSGSWDWGRFQLEQANYFPYRSLILQLELQIKILTKWWSSGQHDCHLLRRSEFETCLSLHFFCKIIPEKNENKQKEAGLANFF